MAKRHRSFGEEASEKDKKKVSTEGFKKALKVFRFTLPYKWTFVIGFIFLILSQITSMSIPLLMGQMVGAIVSPDKTTPLPTSNPIGNMNVMGDKLQNVFHSAPNFTLNEVTGRTCHQPTKCKERQHGHSHKYHE